ncbi:MAG: hypothetical protein ACM30E_06665 [Nitrososphaerales archaeon]
MLDDVIASRSEAQDHNRRIAANVQRIARFVVIPSAALMLLGLVAFRGRGAAAQALLSQGVVPLGSLFSRATFSAVGAMSVGLLAFALLPLVNVLYILADSVVHKRWTDAAAAAAVATILVAGILLGRA